MESESVDELKKSKSYGPLCPFPARKPADLNHHELLVLVQFPFKLLLPLEIKLFGLTNVRISPPRTRGYHRSMRGGSPKVL